MWRKFCPTVTMFTTNAIHTNPKLNLDLNSGKQAGDLLHELWHCHFTTQQSHLLQKSNTILQTVCPSLQLLSTAIHLMLQHPPTVIYSAFVYYKTYCSPACTSASMVCKLVCITQVQNQTAGYPLTQH